MKAAFLNDPSGIYTKIKWGAGAEDVEKPTSNREFSWKVKAPCLELQSEERQSKSWLFSKLSELKMN